ncbi:hypothetical protein M3Y96_01028800 [Aphelenchoides besseyi]|nr:hypothetical protein M3Y96_01028800 [Aphelenchoides besseyi]
MNSHAADCSSPVSSPYYLLRQNNNKLEGFKIFRLHHSPTSPIHRNVVKPLSGENSRPTQTENSSTDSALSLTTTLSTETSREDNQWGEDEVLKAVNSSLISSRQLSSNSLENYNTEFGVDVLSYQSAQDHDSLVKSRHSIARELPVIIDSVEHSFQNFHDLNSQSITTKSNIKRPSGASTTTTSSQSTASKSKSGSTSSSSQTRRLSLLGRAKSTSNQEHNGIDAKPASVQVVAATLGHLGKKQLTIKANGTMQPNKKLRKSTSMSGVQMSGKLAAEKSQSLLSTSLKLKRVRSISPKISQQNLRFNSYAPTHVSKPPLPPVPERRRRRRLQRTPQIVRSQSYTAATMSSALKRFDATPISNRPRSPLIPRRVTPGYSSSVPSAARRRLLLRGNSTTNASTKTNTKKSNTPMNERRGSLQRKNPTPKKEKTLPQPMEDRKEDMYECTENECVLKLKSRNLEYVSQEVVAHFATPPGSAQIEEPNEATEARQSTATTEYVNDDDEEDRIESKGRSDSRSTNLTTPTAINSTPRAIDHSKKLLLRALFGNEEEENFEFDSLNSFESPQNNLLMTLNRDGTICSTMDEGEVVQLNVGGARFATTKSTLISREPDSFFTQLVQADDVGDLPEPWRSAACRLDNGAYFIDRDGDLFAYVLDYLRNGKLLLPDNFKEIARLREETSFYQLVGMNQQLLPYFNIRYPTKNGIGNYTNGTGIISALETGGFITLGYRGTFAFGRDGQADVKFRKLHRILVCGKAQLCREVFGETLNESRDPSGESTERYTSRLYLKHQCLERACDNLAEKGFKLVTACSSGANGLAAPNAIGSQGGGSQQEYMAQRSSGDFEEQRWAHYTEYVFYREPQVCPSISPLTSPRN